MQTDNPKSINTFLTYSFPESVFDEMYERPGESRQHWEPLITALKSLGQVDLQQRCQDARRLLRDNGVTYTYGEELNRPWQLDLIPLLITSDEWRLIERGLIQRAKILSLVLADLYGPRNLFKNNILPPELIYSHPGFLRRCDGVETLAYLPLYAADLARTADGQMCVVEDRTQAPRGAGYALENRLILSRVLPSWFRDWQVRRLAQFFQTLRNTLVNMAWRKSDDIRIVVLTTGPDDDSYFEHAFLATYLGYTLVQGADLTVRDGRVWLKTLDGLQSIDVILRRVDDHLCDPLELRQDSYFGVAGLLQAARMKNVAIANPLGSGVLENPALMAFMPALAHYFLGEDLQLPSAMTWWCGQKKARDYVLANLDNLVIKQTGTPSIQGELLSEPEREALREKILAQPYLFIGQEKVPRSTIPIFTNDNLEPRQMVVRSFLAASEDDYKVMPGGLTRVASRPDTPIISAQGISKDTWILADQPDEPISLLSPIGEIAALANGRAELPSRVAENLFWLGRYVERGENVIRLLRTVLLQMIEPSAFTDDGLQSLLRAATHSTKTYPGFVGDGAEARLAAPAAELLSVLLDKSRQGSLSFTLQALLYAASSLRERTSPDIKRVFSNLEEDLQVLQVQREAPHDEMLHTVFEGLNHLLTHFAAFTGFAMESMTHSQGWRFLMIGRHLERAQQMIPLLRTLLSKDSSSTQLEYLLTICDSLMTYRRRYRTMLQIQPTLELVLLDEQNPRSLAYQFERLQNYIYHLPRCDNMFVRKNQEERLVLEGLTRLRLANMEELVQDDANHFRTHLDQLLVRLSHLLPNLSDAITNSYFSHIEPPKQLIQFTGGNRSEI
jgi:uncharacterized circularly permuted ATP-grasp superfamily protein/uncharacterized alpha-E superfamily protein